VPATYFELVYLQYRSSDGFEMLYPTMRPRKVNDVAILPITRRKKFWNIVKSATLATSKPTRLIVPWRVLRKSSSGSLCPSTSPPPLTVTIEDSPSILAATDWRLWTPLTSFRRSDFAKTRAESCTRRGT